MFLLHFYILKLIVNILTRATLVVAKKPTNKGFRPIPLKFLNLVFNPQGPNLPPPQKDLENDYRKILYEKYGISLFRWVWSKGSIIRSSTNR